MSSWSEPLSSLSKDLRVYHIAGNFRWVQIFVDKPVSAKMKTTKENQLMMMMSLCVYVDTNLYPCERDCSLHSVCLLNAHCREESACYCAKCQ